MQKVIRNIPTKLFSPKEGGKKSAVVMLQVSSINSIILTISLVDTTDKGMVGSDAAA